MAVVKGDLSIAVIGDTDPDMAGFATSKNLVDHLHPIGVTIRYGINAIPTATLDLTPSDLGIVCDLEKWRRTPVKVRVETATQGCLTFQGLIDGLSLSQSVGDMRMQLILKNPFQILHEINPKLPGYHSAGVDFTKRVDVLRVDPHADTAQQLTVILNSSIQVDLNKPLFEGVIQLLKAVVTSQVLQSRIQTLTGTGSTAEPAILAAKAVGAQQTKMALALLDHIDYSYVPTYLTLGDYQTLNWVLESICESRSNIFDILIGILDTVGCGLIISNKNAYIVPNTGFLKQSHEATVNFREFSKLPNVLYPAQYNNLVFNDNGYKDVNAVYLISDNKNMRQIAGFYKNPDPRDKGGVLAEVMPYVIGFNNVAFRGAQISEAKKSVAAPGATNTPSTTGSSNSEAGQQAEVITVNTEEEAKIKKSLAANTTNQAAIDRMQTFANQWAQLRYCQLKYADRIGGVTTMFNPSYAPGCVGSLYLRSPGVYIDFFLTEITHEFRVNIPNSGVAQTHLNFNCGRMGTIGSSLLGVGLDQLDLFKAYTDSPGYSAATSAEVAVEFVANLK